jgi:PKD repeat protein
MTYTTPRNQVSVNAFGTSAPTTIPATLDGSLIVVQLQVQLTSGTLASVTDNIGNTYTMVPLANPGVSQRHVETWYCLAAAAGVTTVTPNTGSGTSVNIAGGISEWPGGATAMRTQASLNNTASLTPPPATATPAVADLVISQIAYQASVASTQQEHLADGTYTALPRVTRGTTNMWAGAYKVATSTAATGPTWTMDASVGTGELTTVFTQATWAAFTASSAGLAATFDASTSVPSTGTTIASYAWSFGDTTTGSGVSPAHTYATGGTYTVQLTITDSAGQSSTTTRSVTVTAPTAQVTPVAVVNAAGWTVTGAAGSAVTAVSDLDQASYVVGTGLFRVTLGALITPAAGTDMTVTVEADAIGATSGTLSAKLYEGATVRAIAAAQPLTMATAGTNTASPLTFTFAAASIANVTNWNALQLELSAAAS